MKIFFDSNRNEVVKPEGAEVSWRVSVYAVVRRGDEILMVVPQWNSLWELPGGGVELGEGLFEAMVRECHEETGYKIAATGGSALHIGESNFYDRVEEKFFHSIFMVFAADLVSEEQDEEAIDREEIEKVAWVPLSECTEKNCHPIIWPAVEGL